MDVAAGSVPPRPSIQDRLRVISDLARTFATSSVVETIAVVGNQPLGPDAERAAMIDASDLVIRVNGFRLDEVGGQRSVGSRCDVVVFNRGVRATPWFFRGYRDRLYLMIEPGRLHHESDQIPPWWPTDLGFFAISNRDVIVPFNRGMGLDPVFDGKWATTGATAIGLAERLFPEAVLRVTGFSFLDSPDQTSWQHAYGDACIVGGEHRLNNESSWLRGLVDSGRAVFRR